MKRNLWLINFMVIVVIIAVLGGGGYYYYQSSSYIKTDNAHVAGDLQTIAAPASGKVTEWHVNEGETVDKNKELGKVSDGKQDMAVSTADGGTIVKESVNQDQLVQAGQTLAQAIDMKKLFVIANIDEKDISDVTVGSSVDVTVDGDSGTVVDGTVEEIGSAANSVFSLMGQQTTSGNYTKVTQYIPVKISIENYSDAVMPGMNAEVKIEK